MRDLSSVLSLGGLVFVRVLTCDGTGFIAWPLTRKPRNSTSKVVCLTTTGNLISMASACFKTSKKNYTEAEKGMLRERKFYPFLRGMVIFITISKLVKRAIERNGAHERIILIMMLRLPLDITFSIKVLEGQRMIETEEIKDTSPDEIFYMDGACLRNGKPECKLSRAVLAVRSPSLSTTGLVPLKKQSNNIAELYAVL